MAENSTKGQKDFFEEFGAILVARHGDNRLVNDLQNAPVDEAACDFARYLRAVRSNARWSQLELAEKAGLTEAEIVALEHGLILSTKIKPKSLHALAKALDKDIEDFALILEREIPRPDPAGTPARLREGWRNWAAYFASGRKSLVVAALVLAVVIGSGLLAYVIISPPGSSVSANEQLSGFGQAAISQVHIGLIVVLLLLLVWVAVWNRHLPPRIKGMNWERGLVYVTPVVLSCMWLAALLGYAKGHADVQSRSRAGVLYSSLPATCTVNSTADDGVGTLRECLTNAVDGQTITFDANVFPPENPATITLQSALPSIVADRLTLDGSDAGVILDGSALPGYADGLYLYDTISVTVQGLEIVNFPGDGIHIYEGTGNLIGGDNTVGAGPLGQGNLISSNGNDGVLLRNSDHNTISGNYIGTDASGAVALGNLHGVSISYGEYNLIGGDTPGECNLISGNGEHGVYLYNVDDNMISGNRIGTDASGTMTLGNAQDVVYIDRSSNATLINNLISGNRAAGLFGGLFSEASSNTLLIGNSFGFSFNGQGYWGEKDNFYDMDYLRTGANAWMGYGLLFYTRKHTDTQFMSVTTRVADYILDHQVVTPTDERFGLFKGSLSSWITETDLFTDTKVEWVATEHNIDAYFFLRDLGQMTGDSHYTDAAELLRANMPKLWDEAEGRLNQGMGVTGILNTGDALDAASWGAMYWIAVGDLEKARRSLEYADRAYSNTVTISNSGMISPAISIWGYKPYSGTTDVVWSEGSLGVAMAYFKLGHALLDCGDPQGDAYVQKARDIVAEMEKLQELDPEGVAVGYAWGDSRWHTTDLTQSMEEPDVWTGSVPYTDTLTYFVQAVDGSGNVSICRTLCIQMLQAGEYNRDDSQRGVDWPPVTMGNGESGFSSTHEWFAISQAILVLLVFDVMTSVITREGRVRKAFKMTGSAEKSLRYKGQHQPP